METSGNYIRDSDEQEVRHDYHDVHRSEHVDDDPGPLRAVRHVELRPGQPQPWIYLHLHDGVRTQDICSPATLFH